MSTQGMMKNTPGPRGPPVRIRPRRNITDFSYSFFIFHLIISDNYIMNDLCKSDLPMYLSSVPDMVVMLALVVDLAMVVRVVIVVKTGMLVMVWFVHGHVSWPWSRWSC